MTSTASPTTPESPSVRGMIDEVGSLVGFVAQAGPPPFILGGALVLGTLLLAGPFALAVTLVVAMALAAASVALLAAAVVAIVMAPYALVRGAQRSWASHPLPHLGLRARATSTPAAGRVR